MCICNNFISLHMCTGGEGGGCMRNIAILCGFVLYCQLYFCKGLCSFQRELVLSKRNYCFPKGVGTFQRELVLSKGS